jgi:putative transposase
MPRKPRELESGLAYHLYNRSCGRSPIFRRPDQYYLFLDCLGHEVPDAIEIRALCIMPNHWHSSLLLHDAELLSPWLQRALTKFGRCYRARWGGTGPIWQGRTHSKPISSDLALARLEYYIEQNPVAARLVASPEDWRWSSANPQLRAAYPWIRREF